MITAQDVKKLRDKTGAGMMDCKTALTEAAGDFEKAIEILRKKGQKVSAARADKATTEGAVFVQTNDDHSLGIIVALSCETDFVAKTDALQQLGQQALAAAMTHQPADEAALLQLTIDGTLVQDKISELVGKTGEKITIGGYAILRGELVVPYIHTGQRLGVLVALHGSQPTEAVIEAGQDVAMQIAAMKPLALDKDDIDAAVVEKELAIGKEIARNEGKPEAVLDKIAQGRLEKFFKENTLLQQTFVRDNTLTVQSYLKSVAPQLTVTAFERVSVG